MYPTAIAAVLILASLGNSTKMALFFIYLPLPLTRIVSPKEAKLSRTIVVLAGQLFDVNTSLFLSALVQ
jgi:hypothetical protein